MTDPFMPLLRRGFDPVPDLAERRIEQPVGKLEFPFGISAWLLTRHADVKQVLGDVSGYSNDFARMNEAVAGQVPTVDPGGLGFADPPDHTRLRKLLTPEFTVHRLNRLKPRITAIVDERLDAVEAAGQPADLVEEFAMPIPSLVMCELLGVPYEDRDVFQTLSASRFDIFANLDNPMGAITESLAYLKGLVLQKRENPDDGLLGAIITSQGDAITDDELAGLADGLLTGGHETTASMLSLGALMLTQRPDLADMLRAGEQTEAIVDDLLRYMTVVQIAFPRFAREDTVIGGEHIAKGEMILCSLSSADRDPDFVGEPDTVDPKQASTAHFAFGYGVHRCVGAELARIELRIAFPALVRRFPALRPALPLEQLEFRQYSIVHGLETLPMNW